MESMETIRTKLLEQGVNAQLADACSQLFNSVLESQQYLGSAADGANAYKLAWKEYYSKKHQRFYYVNEGNGDNGWHVPPPVAFKEWLVDSELFGVDVTVARTVFRQLSFMFDTHWAVPDALWECLGLLSKLIGNVTGCNNTVDKYRTVKADNPKIRDKVLALEGAKEILTTAGFRRQGAGTAAERYEFPGSAGEGLLRTATLTASRLGQLVDRRGMTGNAIAVNDDSPESGNSAPRQSKHSGKPGFRYQTEIYECSECAHPINDGSERLWTRNHDSPKGEFRYACQGCDHHLCERCWDRLQAGHITHTQGHTFKTCFPKESRHGVVSNESENNPWGVQLGQGASASRALQRLYERYGVPNR
mmetsp:Transcript_19998/g.50749  ORF Transcript_19998/g.50749 Transcript_19998/m.50749 type:complete len:362 (-) Transcript_19998:94-1179(-)